MVEYPLQLPIMNMASVQKSMALMESGFGFFLTSAICDNLANEGSSYCLLAKKAQCRIYS